MVTQSRQVIIGNTVVLEVDVKGPTGLVTDADTTPQVEIKDADGNVVRPLSSTDVIRVKEGRYRLNYTVSSTATSGVWADRWTAIVNGFSTEALLTFTVLSKSAAIDVAGAQIGDDPVEAWTEDEICGINILLHQLKCRLKNDAKAEVTDAYGNITLEDCPIFSDDELLCFLINSLSEFNQVPHFTNFRFSDQVIYERYAHVIVEGAFILAMGAQMLLEASREFTLSDQGITLQPPPLSTTMNNELGHFVQRHTTRLEKIKWSIKPAPTGFGTFRNLNGLNPNVVRLRHLRGRRII